MSQGSAAIGSWENAGEKACDQMYQALNKASSKILELKNCTFKKIPALFFFRLHISPIHLLLQS